MELCYRGVNYEWNPHFSVTTKSGIQGKYRGIPQEFRQSASLTSQTRQLHKYRGVTY